MSCRKYVPSKKCPVKKVSIDNMSVENMSIEKTSWCPFVHQFIVNISTYIFTHPTFNEEQCHHKFGSWPIKTTAEVVVAMENKLRIKSLQEPMS